MASYTYSGVRAGLVSALSSLGLQSRGYVLAAPQANHIECSPAGISYDEAMARGHDLLLWRVRITVALNLDEPAQQRLDEYLAPSGASSVKTLLETDSTLGGVVKDLHVREVSGYEFSDLPSGGQALSATWEVAIFA